MSGLYGCHNHTLHSHDSSCVPEDLCEAAIGAGLAGIAITDHVDTGLYHEYNVHERVCASVATAERLKAAYAGRLKVFAGTEIGENYLDPVAVRELLDDIGPRLDILLGSVHTVRFPGYIVPYAWINFSVLSEKTVYQFLCAYFADVREMLITLHPDVLCHLTCPLRYITGKFGIPVDMTPFAGAMEEILRICVAEDIALEVNTSGTDGVTGLMPSLATVERYLALGGRRLTLASDAHKAARVDVGFAETVEALKSIGVKELCYFEKRQPVFYGI